MCVNSFLHHSGVHINLMQCIDLGQTYIYVVLLHSVPCDNMTFGPASSQHSITSYRGSLLEYTQKRGFNLTVEGSILDRKYCQRSKSP
jgi:hypothetical protein